MFLYFYNFLTKTPAVFFNFKKTERFLNKVEVVGDLIYTSSRKLFNILCEERCDKSDKKFLTKFFKYCVFITYVPKLTHTPIQLTIVGSSTFWAEPTTRYYPFTDIAGFGVYLNALKNIRFYKMYKNINNYSVFYKNNSLFINKYCSYLSNLPGADYFFKMVGGSVSFNGTLRSFVGNHLNYPVKVNPHFQKFFEQY
jgi:hypothetical protein